MLKRFACYGKRLGLLLVFMSSFFSIVTVVAKGQPSATQTPAPATLTPAPATLTPAQILEQQNKKFLALETMSRALSLLENLYVDEKAVDEDILIEKAIRGMANTLDPHSSYLSPQDLREFSTDTSGKFGGIGVVVSHARGQLEVIEVMANSPAAKAGIEPGDIIFSIEGFVVTSKNGEELSQKIRGAAGSFLAIETISKKKPGKPRAHKLQREVIRTQSVAQAHLGNGFLYLKISIFQEDTGETVDKILREAEEQIGGSLNGLVMDLRNNPGGLLDQAVRIADLFIDSGVIVSTIGRDKSKQEVEYATKRTTHPYMPVIVLTNHHTASASEIVAGALQDHNRALVMGTTSFGKGSVQSIIQLPNGGGLKITVARYYTPKGRTIQAKGITPDIPVTENSTASGSTPEEADLKKESDLAGHLEASDLRNALQKEGPAAEVEQWPAFIKKDTLVQMAFTYLKGLARFQKNSTPK